MSFEDAILNILESKQSFTILDLLPCGGNKPMYYNCVMDALVKLDNMPEIERKGKIWIKKESKDEVQLSFKMLQETVVEKDREIKNLKNKISYLKEMLSSTVHIPKPKDTKLFFGKHKGKTIEELNEEQNYSYIVWLALNCKTEKFTSAAVDILKRDGRCYVCHKTGIDEEWKTLCDTCYRLHLIHESRQGHY